MNQIIEIIVAPSGQSRVETHGFAGQGCRTASNFIESALGHQTSEQLTTEFHQVVGDRTVLKEGRQT